MSVDLSFIKGQIERHYPNAHARLMQLGPAQHLDIEIEGVYFVLEGDPDEEGIGFSQVRLGLDFGGADQVFYGDDSSIFARVSAMIDTHLESV